MHGVMIVLLRTLIDPNVSQEWNCNKCCASCVQVQSWTPQLILKPLKQSPANSLVALLWCTILIACPLFMGGMLQVRDPPFIISFTGTKLLHLYSMLSC